MKTCLTFNGEKFSSDMELDSHLFNEFYGKVTTESGDYSYSVDFQQTTLNTIESISKKVPTSKTRKSTTVDEDGGEYSYDSANCPGVTTFTQTWGDPGDLRKPIVPPMDVDAYFDNEATKLRRDGLSESEIQQWRTAVEKLWKQLTDLGDDVHAMFEAKINGTEWTPKTVVDGQPAFSDRVSEQLEKSIDIFLDDIKRKHGKNCKIMTEVPIISNRLGEMYEAAGLKAINGRVDLMVVDESGRVHIYDFKVSRKEVGEWNVTNNMTIQKMAEQTVDGVWSSTKKRAAAYQMSLYRCILEQYGLTVGSPTIVPIKLDLEYGDGRKSTLSEVKGAYVDFDNINSSVITPDIRDNSRIIIPKEKIINVDLVKAVDTTMTKAFPTFALETQIQRVPVTVENYINNHNFVHRVDESTDEIKRGKYWFWNRYSKTKVYCHNEEELRTALESYVESENAKRSGELSDLATELEMACEQGSDYSGQIYPFNKYSKHIADYCQKTFGKYIINAGEWTLHNNPDLIDAGIFVFEKQGQIEIVSLTHNDINGRVDLDRGSSILGHSTPDYKVDEHTVFKATNGTIDLIKVMSILNASNVIGPNAKVMAIYSHNIWEGKGMPCYLDQLYKNWEMLCQKYEIENNLKGSQFANPVEYALMTIGGIVKSNGTSFFTKQELDIEFSADTIVDAQESIQYLIRKLIDWGGPESGKLREALSHDKADDSHWDFDDPYQKAYSLLTQAQLWLSGQRVYVEMDPAKWVHASFGKGGNVYTGLNVNSPGTSPSLNIQSLSNIFAVASTHIARQEMKYGEKYRKVFKEFYLSKNRNALMGGEISYFDNLFVRDSMGNIDKSFMLKDPSDSSLTKEEAAVIRMFLDIVNGFRYKTPEEYQRAIEEGRDREVPLAIGSSKSHRHNRSIKEGVKAKYDEALNFLQIFSEQSQQAQIEKQNHRFFNKYNMSSKTRGDLLSKHDIGHFETHLEELLLDIIHSYVREDVMNGVLPQVQGIKIALQYNQSMYGQKAPNIIKYIEDYINSNVYGETIMDQHLRPVYKTLSVIKRINTAAALGFNLRSGFRELLQGVWIHMSRTMAEAYGKDQFTKKDIVKAWGIIFRTSVKDVNTLTLVDALNVDYKMANADSEQIQKILSQSRAGAKNFDSDKLYFANKVPDTYHRMGILIAKMIHDGCWEAHSMDENDMLIYDFTKDKRFSLLNDPSADKESKEYKEQKGLYTTMRLQFNKEGWSIKDGEALPRAYTIQEGTSIKAFSEMCFGHYDNDTQMLAKKTFLGAFVLQYRTFLSAKLEQWILKPGTYNQGQYVDVTNEDGIKYVRVYTEDEDGTPHVEVKLETELQPGDQWDYLKDWQGRFMEGILYSMFDFSKALFTGNFKQLKELWAVPTKRCNFKLFLHDMVWMSILMAIVSALLLDNDDVELGPVGYFGATALYTSFSDGPITSIMHSMFGDLNPTIKSQSEKIVENTYAVFSGKKTIGAALTSSVGALAPLKRLEVTT